MTERKTAAKADDKTQNKTDDKPLTGVFVATDPLHVDGVLAFNPGDVVPAGHVDRHGWRDKVHPFGDDNDNESEG